MGFKERLKAYGFKNILVSRDIQFAFLLTLGAATLSNIGYFNIQTGEFVSMLVPAAASVLGLLLVVFTLYITVAGRKFALKLMPNRETYNQFIFLFEYTFYLLVVSMVLGVLYTTLRLSDLFFFLYVFITIYAFISLMQFTSLIVNLVGLERIRQLYEERREQTAEELVNKVEDNGIS